MLHYFLLARSTEMHMTTVSHHVHHHGKQKSYPRLFFVPVCSNKMTTKLLLITYTSSLMFGETSFVT